MSETCAGAHRVSILTGTRADWGLLTPLATALKASPDMDLSVVATNMHLDERFGMTVDEISAAGFDIGFRVPVPVADDSSVARVHAMARTMEGMAKAFDTLRPDCVVILGDRFEMFAAATTAAMMRIPIVHIAGGTVSYGAVDDSLRHGITKLASLHLVETEEHRRRVLQMGESPERVVVAGALGVWNIMHHELLAPSRLAESLGGFDLKPENSLMVTYHPATLDDALPAERFTGLLKALGRFPDMRILMTGANNDAGGLAINRLASRFAADSPGRVKFVPSLGMLRYLSALKCVGAVAGNSSSGIVEVPSMGIPTVDIGIRQKGRQCADSVIHCEDDADSIAEAIRQAFSPEMRAKATVAHNPYFREDTVGIMTDAIATFLKQPHTMKIFNDMPCQF